MRRWKWPLYQLYPSHSTGNLCHLLRHTDWLQGAETLFLGNCNFCYSLFTGSLQGPWFTKDPLTHLWFPCTQYLQALRKEALHCNLGTYQEHLQKKCSTKYVAASNPLWLGCSAFSVFRERCSFSCACSPMGTGCLSRACPILPICEIQQWVMKSTEDTYSLQKQNSSSS